MASSSRGLENCLPLQKNANVYYDGQYYSTTWLQCILTTQWNLSGLSGSRRKSTALPEGYSRRSCFSTVLILSGLGFLKPSEKQSKLSPRKPKYQSILYFLPSISTEYGCFPHSNTRIVNWAISMSSVSIQRFRSIDVPSHAMSCLETISNADTWKKRLLTQKEGLGLNNF